MKTLTETQKAYMAGLLDGEGCIGVFKQKSSGKMWQFDFGVRVIITNTNEMVLIWVKEITGAGCMYKSKKAFKENWSPVHRWQVTAEQARSFIKTIYPYLKIKKDIADIVLQLPHLPSQRKYSGRTQEEYENQNRIFGLAKIKNVRGFNPLTKE